MFQGFLRFCSFCKKFIDFGKFDFLVGKLLGFYYSSKGIFIKFVGFLFFFVGFLLRLVYFFVEFLKFSGFLFILKEVVWFVEVFFRYICLYIYRVHFFFYVYIVFYRYFIDFILFLLEVVKHFNWYRLTFFYRIKYWGKRFFRFLYFIFCYLIAPILGLFRFFRFWYMKCWFLPSFAFWEDVLLKSRKFFFISVGLSRARKVLRVQRKNNLYSSVLFYLFWLRNNYKAKSVGYYFFSMLFNFCFLFYLLCVLVVRLIFCLFWLFVLCFFSNKYNASVLFLLFFRYGFHLGNFYFYFSELLLVRNKFIYNSSRLKDSVVSSWHLWYNFIFETLLLLPMFFVSLYENLLLFLEEVYYIFPDIFESFEDIFVEDKELEGEDFLYDKLFGGFDNGWFWRFKTRLYYPKLLRRIFIFFSNIYNFFLFILFRVFLFVLGHFFFKYFRFVFFSLESFCAFVLRFFWFFLSFSFVFVYMFFRFVFFFPFSLFFVYVYSRYSLWLFIYSKFSFYFFFYHIFAKRVLAFARCLWLYFLNISYDVFFYDFLRSFFIFVKRVFYVFAVIVSLFFHLDKIYFACNRLGVKFVYTYLFYEFFSMTPEQFGSGIRMFVSLGPRLLRFMLVIFYICFVVLFTFFFISFASLLFFNFSWSKYVFSRFKNRSVGKGLRVGEYRFFVLYDNTFYTKFFGRDYQLLPNMKVLLLLKTATLFSHLDQFALEMLDPLQEDYNGFAENFMEIRYYYAGLRFWRTFFMFFCAYIIYLVVCRHLLSKPWKMPRNFEYVYEREDDFLGEVDNYDFYLDDLNQAGFNDRVYINTREFTYYMDVFYESFRSKLKNISWSRNPKFKRYTYYKDVSIPVEGEYTFSFTEFKAVPKVRWERDEYIAYHLFDGRDVEREGDYFYVEPFLDMFPKGKLERYFPASYDNFESDEDADPLELVIFDKVQWEEDELGMMEDLLLDDFAFHQHLDALHGDTTHEEQNDVSYSDSFNSEELDPQETNDFLLMPAQWLLEDKGRDREKYSLNWSWGNDLIRTKKQLFERLSYEIDCSYVREQHMDIFAELRGISLGYDNICIKADDVEDGISSKNLYFMTSIEKKDDPLFDLCLRVRNSLDYYYQISFNRESQIYSDASCYSFYEDEFEFDYNLYSEASMRVDCVISPLEGLKIRRDLCHFIFARGVFDDYTWYRHIDFAHIHGMVQFGAIFGEQSVNYDSLLSSSVFGFSYYNPGNDGLEIENLEGSSFLGRDKIRPYTENMGPHNDLVDFEAFIDEEEKGELEDDGVSAVSGSFLEDSDGSFSVQAFLHSSLRGDLLRDKGPQMPAFILPSSGYVKEAVQTYKLKTDGVLQLLEEDYFFKVKAVVQGFSSNISVLEEIWRDFSRKGGSEFFLRKFQNRLLSRVPHIVGLSLMKLHTDYWYRVRELLYEEDLFLVSFYTLLKKEWGLRSFVAWNSISALESADILSDYNYLRIINEARLMLRSKHILISQCLLHTDDFDVYGKATFSSLVWPAVGGLAFVLPSFWFRKEDWGFVTFMEALTSYEAEGRILDFTPGGYGYFTLKGRALYSMRRKWWWKGRTYFKRRRNTYRTYTAETHPRRLRLEYQVWLRTWKQRRVKPKHWRRLSLYNATARLNNFMFRHLSFYDLFVMYLHTFLDFFRYDFARLLIRFYEYDVCWFLHLLHMGWGIG